MKLSIFILSIVAFCLWHNLPASARHIKYNDTALEDSVATKQPQFAPDFKIALWDTHNHINPRLQSSKALIKQGLPSVYLLLSPDCKHCQQLASQLLERASHFDNLNLFILTPPFPEDQVIEFFSKNRFPNKNNWHLGIDTEFLFGEILKADATPFVALYDKNQHFIKTLPRIKDVQEILDVLLLK